jgi:hypothetical protein
VPKKAKRLTTKKATKRAAAKDLLGRNLFVVRPPTRRKRMHVAAPSSASEILQSLEISSADRRAARAALDS